MTKHFVLFVLCFSCIAKSKENERIILLADFLSSEFVENNSYRTTDGGVVIKPSIFSVSFNILKRLQSENKFDKKTLNFKLKIHTDYALSRANGYVLIVQQKSLDSYALLDWGFVTKTICIDKKFIEKEYQDIYFQSPFNESENEKCRFI